MSNVIDADHENSCLLTNKGYFSSPSWVLIGVQLNFMIRLLEHISTINSKLTHMTTMLCVGSLYRIHIYTYGIDI